LVVIIRQKAFSQFQFDMSDLFVPPEKVVKEGFDIIVQTAKDPTLRDLGMEMLSYGIRVLEPYSQTDPAKFGDYIRQCRSYYDSVAHEWNYKCDKNNLDVVVDVSCEL
jgi:hypothetical protein